MKVFIAADHAGFESKNRLAIELEKDYTVHDMGPYEFDPDDDYPIYAKRYLWLLKKILDLWASLFVRAGRACLLRPIKSLVLGQ